MIRIVTAKSLFIAAQIASVSRSQGNKAKIVQSGRVYKVIITEAIELAAA